MELAVYFLLLIVLGIVVIAFGKPFFRGAPYAPTDKRTVNTMVKLAHVKPSDRAVDVGSGDGRIVIALARSGAGEVVGFEINPFLVWLSNFRLRGEGTGSRAKVVRKNFWNADFSGYNLVTVFGIPYIMAGLERKLIAELPNDARVISNKFRFPHWKPTESSQGVYRYDQRFKYQKLTLCIIYREGRILLGMKKKGFGAARWNGFGGKVYSGEPIEQAAQREVVEEIGVLPTGLIPRGLLTFFIINDELKLDVHLFSAANLSGEPRESDEMKPQWFNVNDIPYHTMWPDDRYWLPKFLLGKNINGTFWFKDVDTLIHHDLEHDRG